LFARKPIYVVDDDLSMRRSLERLLRKHGFDAVAFDSAGALLRRRLASEGATVPVIYITGNDCQANQLAAIQSGCAAYLAKPFAASELIDSIERACAEHG
jgi:FixJ family two-component response regulator